MDQSQGGSAGAKSQMRRALTRRGLVGLGASVAAGLAALASSKQVEATHGAGADTTALHVGQVNPATQRTRLQGAVNAGDTVGILDISNTAGAGLSVDVANSGKIAARAISNLSNGVEGVSTSGRGVNGISGNGIGVKGTSTNLQGVVGESTTNVGVAGGSNSNTGVLGTSAAGIGVEGRQQNAGNNNAAIKGSADQGQIGVWGQSISGPGVQGSSTNSVGVAAGSINNVALSANAGGTQNGITATSVGGAGVSAASTNSFGVLATSTNNTAAHISSQNSLGLFAETKLTESTDFNNPTKFAARIKGGDGLIIEGALRVTGQKQAYVVLPDGTARNLFCTEGPEAMFEDHGKARTEGGFVRVAIDKEFAPLISTPNYFVQVTPLGPSHGLFVSNIGSDGFDVRENEGGNASVEFFWRVTGRRKDLEGKYERLTKASAPPRVQSYVEAHPRVVPANEIKGPVPNAPIPGLRMPGLPGSINDDH